MNTNFYLVVVAGGHGVRMGSSKPKQFLEIGGKPILRHTIEKFKAALPAIKIVTVLPKEYIEPWKEYCLNVNFSCPQTIVAGGLTRFHSVRNALEKVPNGAYVAIHDGVRPLLSINMIKSMFFDMEGREALIPVVPCNDTLKAIKAEKKADGKMVYTTIEGEQPDRSKIFCAQTPQIFLSDSIKKAYSQAYDMSFTDDASVAQKAGIPLDWCSGEKYNIKITTPDDIVIAGMFLEKGLSII